MRSAPIVPGDVFARLTVLNRGPNAGRLVRWECSCECGARLVVAAQALRTKNTRSCGCLRRETVSAMRLSHGMSETPTYRVWAGMLARCTNPKSEHWNCYGGRGIRVCARWGEFAEFYSDMGVRPPGKTLDRVDVNGDYGPGNCRWATQKEQTRNTRRTRYAELDGVRRSIAEWAEISGTPYSMIRDRLNRGWDFSRALTEPRNG